MSGEVMRVDCRNCGESVSADNINIDKLVAKCGACHAVFGFDVAGGATKPRKRENIAMPKSVTVENQGGELVIVHRWRSIVAVLFLTVFTLIWNSITWTFFVIMWQEGQGFVMAFLSIFVAVGVGVAYLTLGILLNSTEIRVSGRRLTVKSGPLPMPGSVDVRSEDIDQVWVEEKVSHSNSRQGHSSTSVHYPVFLRMKDGTKKTLARYGQDSDLSLFLEQEIETHLGIEDRPMRGEF
tara:strand:+ start:160082 stop:160795 length:714 start_codon:yes stop_codon:yes gene_type:complete